VSDAGVANTFGVLMPKGRVAGRAARGTRVAIAPSGAHIGLYLGVRGTAEELGLPKSNLWIFPGYDHDATRLQTREDPAASFPGVFISFPSAKDPDFQRRHPGVATVEAATFAPYGWFREWENDRWQERSTAYDVFKSRLTNCLLQTVYREVPSIEGSVLHAELSTPLSTRHFTGHAHGEIYGLAHTPARFDARWLRPKTPIEGLFLCGADVAGCGVAGATAGGVLAASVVLGKLLLPEIMHRGRHATRDRRIAGGPVQPI